MGEFARKLAARLRGVEPPKPCPPGLHPDKGKRDGRCNRTACQTKLAGRRQWTMPNRMVLNGLFHYCGVCAADFNAWDQRIGEAPRCTIVCETSHELY